MDNNTVCTCKVKKLSVIEQTTVPKHRLLYLKVAQTAVPKLCRQTDRCPKHMHLINVLVMKSGLCFYVFV